MDGANVANEYTYDHNGNLTKDLNRKITSITYNSLNLPHVITFNDGKSVTYGYDASGSKLSVTYTSGANTVKMEYAGNKVYRNGTLSMLLTEEGYVTLSGSTPTYHYYLRDHQGSNRVVMAQNGTVLQVNHYYPFGGLFGEGTQTSKQPYKYNGKELDREMGLNLYDYGFRLYDPLLGRFHSVDPLAELYKSHSSYLYALNNPIRYKDILGLGVEDDEENKKKIAIDPGHGDHHNSNKQVDPGAVNGGDYEKDIVLNISKAVTEKLGEEGYTVTQTRDGDVKDAGERFQWRIDKAEESDVFVSIHNNASSNESPNGFEVFYKKGDENSKSLAESIQLENTLFSDRGIKEGNFRVLNGFKGTAVLVEAGFISNTKDLKILKTQSTEVGNQIATGIINFLKK